MQDRDLFEYSIIRLVPSVERQEFINVGAIIYCPDDGHLQADFELNEDRVKALSDDVDLEEVRNHLEAIKKICLGGSGAGRIGRLSAGERFRWLTAPRSTIVQMSPVHTGICGDPEETMTSLMEKMVR